MNNKINNAEVINHKSLQLFVYMYIYTIYTYMYMCIRISSTYNSATFHRFKTYKEKLHGLSP
jgi:hypothetical protein